MPIRTTGTPTVITDPIGPPKTGGTVTPQPSLKFSQPKPNIELGPHPGRGPTAADFIIHKGFDGLAPEAATAKIVKNCTTKVAAQNQALVKTTAQRTYRDFNVAMNNVFTPNTPNNQFVKSLAPAQVWLVGAMNGIFYKAVQPDGTTAYYQRDWSGNFGPMAKPPPNVVMEAAVRTDPPGLVMTYPKWKNPALTGPLSTVTELG
jgi:hypothetical protein